MASGCRYCTTNHAAALRARFGFSDAMLVELGAAVAQASSAVAAWHLRRAGIAGVLGDGPAREIADAPGGFGSPAAPALDDKTRALVGLAVASCLGAEEVMASYAGLARRRGATEAELREAAAVVLLFARVNQFTMGMLLEPVSRRS